MEKVAIIGSGFSGLSAACYMAKAGYQISVYEKNPVVGGRARQFCRDGFTFDMGPTFYWMPDVLEKFFADFNHTPSDYYQLERLDPGYEIYYGPGDSIRLPADQLQLYNLFESYEIGSREKLHTILQEGKFNYQVAMDDIVYRPGRTPLELITPETIKRFPEFLTSIRRSVRSRIRNPKLQQVLEFPVLFLGAKPADTPAFYCFMNHADMELGTWHVRGGIYNVIKGMEKLAESLGVKIHTSSPVTQIQIQNNKVTGLGLKNGGIRTDILITSADYHHSEMLLPSQYRNYREEYWKKRVMAPSALLFYIGFSKKLSKVSHHTLFFDHSFDEHARNIYDKPAWPETPLFYVSIPTQSDPTMGPAGKDAAVILIPLAAGLQETEEIKQKYLKQIILRMEHLTGQSLADSILFSHSFAGSDFIRDYHAYKGNAYGLANTLLQTAFLKPKIYNRKLKNLFYAGQLTVPGPGVPPAVISGKIAATQALNYLQKQHVYG